MAPPAKRRRTRAPRQYFRCPVPDDWTGWTFVRRLVGRHVGKDFRRGHRWTPRDREDVCRQHSTPALKHRLALRVYRRWQNMHASQDDAGGCVPDGKLLLRPYALFQLSLDRINNDRPHFPDDDLSNLYFVPLGMNTANSVVGAWGPLSCARLRAHVAQDAASDLAPRVSQRILQRACGTRDNANIVYHSVHAAFQRDSTTRATFPTFEAFFQYALHVLRQQGGRCAVSGLFMQHGDLADPSVRGAFCPSLDAVQPTLHHTRGNLRWVCRFLNSTNMDNFKVKYAATTEEGRIPTAWTAPLFRQYIQCAPPHLPHPPHPPHRKREMRVF